MRHSFLVQLDTDDGILDVQKIAEALLDTMVLKSREQAPGVTVEDAEVNYLGAN